MGKRVKMEVTTHTCNILLKWSLALKSKVSELWKIGDKSHFGTKSDTYEPLALFMSFLGRDKNPQQKAGSSFVTCQEFSHKRTMKTCCERLIKTISNFRPGHEWKYEDLEDLGFANNKFSMIS